MPLAFPKEDRTLKPSRQAGPLMRRQTQPEGILSPGCCPTIRSAQLGCDRNRTSVRILSTDLVLQCIAIHNSDRSDPNQSDDSALLQI